MKIIKIDGKEMPSRLEAHGYLKEQFGFPDYYGMNLDAFFDMLTEITEEMYVLYINKDAAYSGGIASVLKDAEQENPRLTIEIL